MIGVAEVVNNNEFKIAIGLTEYGIDRGFDELRVVVVRDDDCDFRFAVDLPREMRFVAFLLKCGRRGFDDNRLLAVWLISLRPFFLSPFRADAIDQLSLLLVPRETKPGFPDDSRAEVNICAFPTFPQDRRELRTAAGTWGGRNGGRRIELVILPGIWTYSSRRLLWNG